MPQHQDAAAFTAGGQEKGWEKGHGATTVKPVLARESALRLALPLCSRFHEEAQRGLRVKNEQAQTTTKREKGTKKQQSEHDGNSNQPINRDACAPHGTQDTHTFLKCGYGPSNLPNVAQSTTVWSSWRLFWTGVLDHPKAIKAPTHTHPHTRETAGSKQTKPKKGSVVISDQRTFWREINAKHVYVRSLIERCSSGHSVRGDTEL